MKPIHATAEHSKAAAKRVLAARIQERETLIADYCDSLIDIINTAIDTAVVAGLFSCVVQTPKPQEGYFHRSMHLEGCSKVCLELTAKGYTLRLSEETDKLEIQWS